MILVSKSKRYGYEEYLIPVKNENNIKMFSNIHQCTWVYYCDGKHHGNIPVMVLPDLVEMFGGEHAIISAGYSKYWTIFKDIDTNEFTFGNKPCLKRSSDIFEQQLALSMPVVDVNLLMKL